MLDNEIMDRQHTSLIMYRSKDGGKTWTSKDIHDDLLKQVNASNTGKKYSIVFQGPGGGMTYKGRSTYLFRHGLIRKMLAHHLVLLVQLALVL